MRVFLMYILKPGQDGVFGGYQTVLFELRIPFLTIFLTNQCAMTFQVLNAVYLFGRKRLGFSQQEWGYIGCTIRGPNYEGVLSHSDSVS